MTLYESGKFEEESANDTQEVIEDMLNRNLTREYLDVLKVFSFCLKIGKSLNFVFFFTRMYFSRWP